MYILNISTGRAKAYRERPIVRPERDKTRSGFHKCLGSRRPMSCPTLRILLTTCRKKNFHFLVDPL